MCSPIPVARYCHGPHLPPNSCALVAFASRFWRRALQSLPGKAARIISKYCTQFIWRFPKMEVPLNHPFIVGLSILNRPFWGTIDGNPFESKHVKCQFCSLRAATWGFHCQYLVLRFGWRNLLQDDAKLLLQFRFGDTSSRHIPSAGCDPTRAVFKRWVVPLYYIGLNKMSRNHAFWQSPLCMCMCI